MKISPKIIELARSIKNPQELVEFCQKEGIEINTQQAQRLIEMSDYTELGEDNLENVAGGICSSDDQDQMPNCPQCRQNDKVEMYVPTSGMTSQWKCTRCNKKF